jgi:hypothetical protein
MARSRKPVQFAPFEPDKAVVSGAAVEAKGVISQAKRYAPLPSPVPYRNNTPINDTCLGAASYYDSDNSPHIFLGDRGRLYKLVNRVPTDVSRSEGYSVDADWQWSFEQFNNHIIATARGLAELQLFTLGSSSAFDDISDSPAADVVFRIRQQLFACQGITVNVSAFNDPTDWTPDSATQAFQTTLNQKFGIITAGLGGEQGAIFQERGIVRLSFTGGDPPYIFDEIEGGRGAVSPSAVKAWGRGGFAVAEDGLYYFDGLEAQPIGQDKVDKYFASDLNHTFRARVVSAIDSARKAWMVAYPSGSSSVCNRLLIFSMTDARWTRDEFDLDALFEMPIEGISGDDEQAIIDLLGTANADALNVSIDSPIWRELRAQWACVTSDRMINTFTGPNRQATIDTGEFEPNPGGQAFVSELHPLIDAPPGQVTASIYGKPYRLDETPILMDSSQMNEYGGCDVRCEARFLRARFEIAEGASWSEASGTHWDAEASGAR